VRKIPTQARDHVYEDVLPTKREPGRFDSSPPHQFCIVIYHANMALKRDAGNSGFERSSVDPYAVPSATVGGAGRPLALR